MFESERATKTDELKISVENEIVTARRNKRIGVALAAFSTPAAVVVYETASRTIGTHHPIPSYYSIEASIAIVGGGFATVVGIAEAKASARREKIASEKLKKLF